MMYHPKSHDVKDLYENADRRDEIIANNDPRSATRTPFTYRAFTATPMEPGPELSDLWHIATADPVAAAVYKLVTGNAWADYKVTNCSAERILRQTDSIWNLAAAVVVARAKTRIADPAHWTQWVEARNSIGHSVLAWDVAAVQWSALGALIVDLLYTGLPMLPFFDALARAVPNMGYMRLQAFNDIADHDDVIALFHSAIAQLEEAASNESYLAQSNRSAQPTA